MKSADNLFDKHRDETKLTVHKPKVSTFML
jgi:hypothetical protein